MKKASKKVKTTKAGAPVAEIIQQRIHEGLCLLCFALSVFLIFSLFSYHHADPAWSHVSQTLRVDNLAGKAGAYIADILLYFSGYMGYLFPGMLLYGAWHLYKMRQSFADDYHISLFALRLTGFIFLVATGAGIASLQIKSYMSLLPFSSGGVVGNSIAFLLYGVFNFVGTTLILYTGFLIGVTLFTGFSWLNIADAVGRNVIAVWGRVVEKAPSLSFKIKLPKIKRKEKPARQKKLADSIESDMQMNHVKSKPEIVRVEPKIDLGSTIMAAQTRAEPILDAPIDPEAPAPPKISRPTPAPVRKKETVLFEPGLEGTLPPLKLLDEADKSLHRGYTNHQLEEMSRQVELRLHDFGVDVKVVAVHPGPVVTRFELQLAAGTKVSKISGLAKDLARSLSMISVRVVEVIPGKSVIGLELPNLDREMVRLREILSSQRYIQTTSPLALALGKDIAGHPVVVDLAKMPHLLVAGTTGSGKSVGLNAMLLSLLYKATPKELRLILIDPKMLELSIYDDIPHLLTPVVTDMKDASNALRWCVAEMERRYKLMASLGVRNLAGYNKKIRDAAKRNHPIPDPFWNPSLSLEPEPLEELPCIVVLADEFADMMMVVGKKIEELITRIAQKARAAGIHLILATQRPSVDVITGLIKANIPTRIAFQVSSKVDSRTILDQQGADQLLGHGDMLYLPPGTSVPIRVHGAFVDDEEVHRVVHDLKRRGSPDYLEAILEHTSAEEMGAIGTAEATESAGGEGDLLYDEAVKIVTETRKASISGIQRRLKIGYNRAANIVESMQAAGVVSAPENNGVREVLAPPPVE